MTKGRVKKIIVLVGPTATGKSDLAVFLARKFKGEIVSADSRQIYRGMDIGTGKITTKEMRGVPHHMLDIVHPKKQFSVTLFQKKAQHAIRDILSRGKLPILVGGTGFYIQAVVYNTTLPEVPPNAKLRKKLSRLPIPKLYAMLKKIDARRAKEIDERNPVRLIRAIEIGTALGNVPRVQKNPLYKTCFVGIDLPDTKLKENIRERLIARFKKGMIAEVMRLHKKGISWKRLESFGLEYRAIALFLQNKISAHEMKESLFQDIWQYAKRQRTWFRKEKDILWFSPKQKTKLQKTVKMFVS